jgi:putative transposase
MDQTRKDFDFEQALAGLQAGKRLTGEDGVLMPLIKQLTEAALAAELEAHLAEEAGDDGSASARNRKNGHTRKTMKTGSGAFDLATPRDREGSFTPQLIKKHQTHMSDEIAEKILSLFGLGMSYRDIGAHIADLYGIEVSAATISTVTDRLIPMLRDWQARPLESLYPIVWLDASHHKIRDEGSYQNRAVYTVLGVGIDGRKDVLGLYVSENEGANFWMSVLADLQNRGVRDILIACVDGLKGFPEAIAATFPQTQVQLCIVHQIRNSLRYVGAKHQKEFMADLKTVYRAPNRDTAEAALEQLAEKWGDKYPLVIRSWQEKWENLAVYFRYPPEIRRVIYTTNTIEAVHRQFRKLTKTKGAFPKVTA